MFKKLQRGWEDIPQNITEQEYYLVKNNKENYPKYYVGLVGYCASFEAKYFGGYARSKKTIRNYFNEGVRNILKQLLDILDVNFICCDYKFFEANKINKSLIYCDLPYENTINYKNKINHNEFWDWARNISKNNYVFVSEYNAPKDFYYIWEKEIKIGITINMKNIRKEKLYTYKKGLFYEQNK